MTHFIIPTRQDVEQLQVGDTAINCFGQYQPVTRIVCRREAYCDGKLFVQFYQKTSTGYGEMSQTMKEGQLIRTAVMSQKSFEIDQIEKDMKAKDQTFREI